MIHIVLPVCNQATALCDLLDGISQVEWPQRERYSVLVVDDGSTDATVSICRSRWEQMPLEVSCHITRRGLGEAMMTGFKHCLSGSASDDVVIALDTRIVSSPALMACMAGKIKSGSDVVIASRYARGGCEIGYSGAMRVQSRASNKLLQVAFGIAGVTDYTCGYRAYSASILERALQAYGGSLIENPECLCSAELLVKLARLGARVTETPLVGRSDRASAANQPSLAGLLKLAILGRPKPPSQLTFAEVGRLGGARSHESEE